MNVNIKKIDNKRRREMKKIIHIAIAGVLCWSLVGCSGGDAKFREQVKQAIESGENKQINSQLQEIFEAEYGWERAEKEAKKYCQALREGQKREDFFAESLFKYREKDRSGNKTTAKEGAYIKLIKIIIYDSAEKSYCSQRRYF